jgi:hypothetical protein
MTLRKTEVDVIAPAIANPLNLFSNLAIGDEG